MLRLQLRLLRPRCMTVRNITTFAPNDGDWNMARFFFKTMYRRNRVIEITRESVFAQTCSNAQWRTRRGLIRYGYRNGIHVSTTQPTDIRTRTLTPRHHLPTFLTSGLPHTVSFFSTTTAMGSNAPNLPQGAAINIRKATPSDAGQIAALGTAVFTHSFKASGCTDAQLQSYLDEAYTTDAILSTLTSPKYHTLVAVDSSDPASTILGFALLNTGSTEPVIEQGNYERPIELQRLYVGLEAHGKGIGKALMAEAERLAREDFGKATMWLGVWERNLVAQGLYGKLGFVRVGEHMFDVGGDPQLDWILVKAL